MTSHRCAVFVLLLAATAGAQAQSPAEARADAALAQLSAHYSAQWAALPPAARADFAARERRWLHATRWQEQQACIAHVPARAADALTVAPAARHADELAADCLAAVTQRHLAGLRAQVARAER